MNKKWLKYAGIRAIKTVCQTAIASIGTAAVMSEVNWIAVASASVLAGILSLLTSLAGIPEVDNEPQVEDATLFKIADDAPVLDAETGKEKTYAEIKAEEIE